MVSFFLRLRELAERARSRQVRDGPFGHFISRKTVRGLVIGPWRQHLLRSPLECISQLPGRFLFLDVRLDPFFWGGWVARFGAILKK